MSLEEINSAASPQTENQFRQCCTSEAWIKRMVAGRPYADESALRSAADQNWATLCEADYLQAFEGHPKIGDVSSLKEKYANTKALAAGEQSSVEQANEETLHKLARGNQDYEEKFGFIFIVCATGKSALEMSNLLQARLPNGRENEIKNAAEEQRKIFQIRIGKLL